MCNKGRRLWDYSPRTQSTDVYESHAFDYSCQLLVVKQITLCILDTKYNSYMRLTKHVSLYHAVSIAKVVVFYIRSSTMMAPVVSLSKTLYSNCLVLVGSRNRFER